MSSGERVVTDVLLFAAYLLCCYNDCSSKQIFCIM